MNSGFPTGILLPESVMQTELFTILMMFVAINTLIYVSLAVAKILPKVYFSDWVRRRTRRSETRSIDPDAPIWILAGIRWMPTRNSTVFPTFPGPAAAGYGLREVLMESAAAWWWHAHNGANGCGQGSAPAV